jgi:hypothetical protein
MPQPTSIHAIRINTDRTMMDLPEFTPTLDNMQAVVGGYIEGVRCTIEGLRMYVNEEGMIRGLPINRIASMFYPGPTFIHGDVIFVGDVDQAGWDTGLTPELAEAVTTVHRDFEFLATLLG